jgi:hypothetical protein
MNKFVEAVAVWSARTCPRFESGDISPHSKRLNGSTIQQFAAI